MTRVREGGEATHYFCIVGTVNCWLLLLLLIFILIRHLAAIGRADDCFCLLQLWLVINIIQNKVQFDPRSLKKFICSEFTFISSCQCKYCILNSSESPFNPRQFGQQQIKGFLFRLLLAAGGELIILDLHPYWLSIAMINYSSFSSMWMWHSG